MLLGVVMLLLGGVMCFDVIVLPSRAKILPSGHKFVTRLKLCKSPVVIVVDWRQFVFVTAVTLPVHSTAIFTGCVWLGGACVNVFYISIFILAIALPVVAIAEFAWRWWSGFGAGWCGLLNCENGHFRHLR
uniref:Secreted protein n=1 Tax=Panstrongylus lignarius TaxID=156445 RepID=A0A224Y0T0_9HEMI